MLGWSYLRRLHPISERGPIDKNGSKGGFAHIAFRVSDTRKTFECMKNQGFNIIDKAPRQGSRGTTVFFVHPESLPEALFGFLIEMVQEG